MNQEVHIRPRPRVMAAACAVALAALATPAHADTFTLDNGVEGRWNLNLSLGHSVRTADADKNLIAKPHGGTAGNGQDDGNLNFKKNDPISSVAKASAELELKHDNLGLFVRGNAWYDYVTSHKGVEHGSNLNGYVPGARLSDDGFDKLSTFSGAAIGDAYVFGNFDLSGNPLQVKAGQQVVNWGESLFIPGLNAMGAFDLTAARRPGAQVKEILRPLPQLVANLGLGNGLSVEAFYQFKWKRTVLDGCGTYWSIADSLNCPTSVVVFGDSVGDDRTQYNGLPLLGKLPAPLLASVGLTPTSPINFRLGRAPETTPKNSGQFGLSSHYFSDELGTDFGVYFTNYHARIPALMVVKSKSELPSVFSGAIAELAAKLPPAAAASLGVLGKIGAGRMAWNYDIENIKAFGVSASTTVGGFSLFGELVHTRDIPVQINVPDLLIGSMLGLGPQGWMAKATRDPSVADGAQVGGYDRKNKTQLQASFIKQIPQIMGADALNVIGEVGVQQWSGIGNAYNSTRYGRGFLFGFGDYTGVPSCAGLNANAGYCSTDGYATKSAWGYRVQAELTYPNAFAGVTLKPRVFLSHDVNGISADNTFLKNRRSAAIGLRADYMSRYYADFTYTRYNHHAKFDQFHDRDYASLVIGANF